MHADPVPPDWLPELRIKAMMADEPVDLRIWREGAETRIEITRGDHLRLVKRRLGHTHGVEPHPA